MIEELCSMITSKDNQRAISEMMVIKVVEQPPDLVVDIRSLSIVLVSPAGVVASTFSLLQRLIDEFHIGLALWKCWRVVVLFAEHP